MHLRLESLSCRRGSRLLFESLSAELAPGTALMIRGPNGSGKSSLLRILAGFLTAETGRIRWTVKKGDPWQEEGFEARVSYLAHANGVKPQLTVRENMEFWAALTDGLSVDPRAALSHLGLSALEDMPAGLLSAGQQRRLALSRLPLTRRPVWLLDEPDTALDSASRTALSGMIANHLAQGGLAIIASHTALDLPDSATLTIGRPAPHAEGRA